MPKAIFDPGYRALIGTIRQARLARKLTQEQVGSKLGVGRNWPHKIERCEIRLDVLQFVRLCRVLELDPGELIRSLQ